MSEPTEKAEWIEYFEGKLKTARQHECDAIGLEERVRFHREVEDLIAKLWVMNLDVHRWAQSQADHSMRGPSSL